MITHLLLVLLWVVYCVLHSVLANESVKAFFKRKWGRYFQYYRLGYNVVALAGLILVVWYGVSIETVQLFRQTLLTWSAGGLIGSIGFVLMLVCIIKYFPGLSGLFTLQQKSISNELIISGVHRFVRHPLYLGTFLFLWGLVILLPFLNLLISTLVITVYTLIGMRFEENKLVKQFGEEYKAYQKMVPRIIPRLKAGERP